MPTINGLNEPAGAEGRELEASEHDRDTKFKKGGDGRKQVGNVGRTAPDLSGPRLSGRNPNLMIKLARFPLPSNFSLDSHI